MADEPHLAFLMPGYVSATLEKKNEAEDDPSIKHVRDKNLQELKTKNGERIKDRNARAAPGSSAHHGGLVASSSRITPPGHHLRPSQEYRHPRESEEFPRRMSVKAATDPLRPSKQATMSNIPRKANTGFSKSTREFTGTLTKHTDTAKRWLKDSFGKKP